MQPSKHYPNNHIWGGGVMIWGCFSYNGVGEMEVIDGRMNLVKHKQIISSNLSKIAKCLELDRNYVFHKDNVPKHMTKTI